MSQTLENLGPYASYQYPAIVGMKADSMFDNVDTFACDDEEGIDFGVVVSSETTGTIRVKTGGGVEHVRGMALHDHIIGSRGGYMKYDAVSTLTRGRLWARVSDPEGIEDGVQVSYDEETGEVAVAGTKLPNATFRSKAVSLPDASQVVWATGIMTYAAIVELHHPFPVAASASPPVTNGGTNG